MHCFQKDDASYCQVICIDTAKLSPVIVYPFLPLPAKSIEQVVEDDLKIDQVMIASCTNGRIEDLRIAVVIMKGKRVAQYEGLMDILIKAGAVVSNPTCGVCLGARTSEIYLVNSAVVVAFAIVAKIVNLKDM